MKYMLLMYWDQAQMPLSTPEVQKASLQAWQDYLSETKAAGALVAYNGLAPVSSATTVRVREGKTLISDGPFAETHEQLGGFVLLDCNNLDEALAWAAKLPNASDGSIEVRPLWNSQ